jgi:DNA-binding CsgD family transcriptional regulator
MTRSADQNLDRRPGTAFAADAGALDSEPLRGRDPTDHPAQSGPSSNGAATSTPLLGRVDPGESAAPGPFEVAVLERWSALGPHDADVAIALACGYQLVRDPLPPPICEASAGDVDETVARLLGSGLITPDEVMPQLVADALLRAAPPRVVRRHLRHVVGALTGAGVELGPVAPRLLRAGLRDQRLVEALSASAYSALAEQPALAAQYYDAAASASEEPSGLRLRHAEACALAGDLSTATAILEQHDRSERTAEPWSAASALAANVAVLRGQTDQAATLWRWRAAQLSGGVTRDRRDAEGAVVLYAVGDVESGDRVRSAAAGAGPGLTDDGLSAMLDALRLSLGPGGESRCADCVAGMAQSAYTSSGQPARRLRPDHPAALAAIAAISCGDLPTAESVLQSASTSRGAVPDISRIAALRAWTAMLAGRLGEAGQWADRIDPRISRDEVWRTAVQVAIARREDDLTALTRLWLAARTTLVATRPDLFSLLPLSELSIVAARMREPDLARPTMTRLAEILDQLGGSTLWSAPYHWAGIQAAILTDRPKSLTPHAAALVAMSRHSPMAEVLAGGARAWVGVLGRDIDVDRVAAAAGRLAEVGLGWDGARLAGHGAARASSRKEAAVLLEVARALQRVSDRVEHSARDAVSGVATAAGQRAGLIDLTRREREVVELVLNGLTYKEVGETLFLSPKTVEHHMARIRRRSGASSRAELLRRLSATIDIVPPLPGHLPVLDRTRDLTRDRSGAG